MNRGRNAEIAGGGRAVAAIPNCKNSLKEEGEKKEESESRPYAHNRNYDINGKREWWGLGNL